MRPLPKHKINVLESNDKSSGFLKVRSKKIEFEYDSPGDEDVLITEDMTIDYIDRKSSFDAVCIVPYFKLDVHWHVYLISCMRPAVAFRNYEDTGRPEGDDNLNMWELPAGIVEADENGNDGLRAAASRELQEEVGFFVRPDYFDFLGHRVFSSVGLCGERIYFLAAEVHPCHRGVPSTDGGPLERGSIVEAVRLRDAFGLIDSDRINDAKTVIGLERLAAKLLI